MHTKPYFIVASTFDLHVPGHFLLLIYMDVVNFLIQGLYIGIFT